MLYGGWARKAVVINYFITIVNGFPLNPTSATSTSHNSRYTTLKRRIIGKRCTKLLGLNKNKGGSK